MRVSVTKFLTATTRRLLVGCLTVFLVVALSGPAVSLADSKGCKLQGSWLGFSDLGGQWISSAHGLGASSGTLALELPEFDPTLGPNFPSAVSLTTLRGVWERVNGNTFAYTIIGMAMDADGDAVWIGKNSGYDTITHNCNLLKIESTLEIFLPFQNPFTETPLGGAFVIPTHYADRMSVDPPALVSP